MTADAAFAVAVAVAAAAIVVVDAAAMIADAAVATAAVVLFFASNLSGSLARQLVRNVGRGNCAASYQQLSYQ